MKRKIYIIVILLLLCISLYFSYQIYTDASRLQVVFLDVGQGDSILIQKGTHQILIDGGPSGKVELAKLGKYLPYFDREIDVVIATHPDKDHIAGLVEAARNYRIGKVLTTAAGKDTQVYKEWKDILDYNKIETLEALRGDRISFEGAEIKILNPEAPVDPAIGEANNESVVARLDYGENSFLFTGDIESPAENKIIASGEDIDVDVLKVAHHGSKYSTSGVFLDKVTPKDAVISVGKNNSYGHPTQVVLEALKERNIDILRTDEKGDIIFKCGNQNAKCQFITQK